MNINTKLFLAGVLIIIIGGIAASIQGGISGGDSDDSDSQDTPKETPGDVTNFAECVRAGNPVMESYPRQCRTSDGETFVEDIGNRLEKQDLIWVEEPLPNEAIESPLTVAGQARGYWYFEASFPVVLEDADGNVLTETFIQADGEWMTEEFVPFERTITFDNPETETGTLILHRDNPSGLPENDDQLRIPVTFDQN